jgi:hypothetical protein
MAKDRFYGEWGAHFPEWPLPDWANSWPEDERRVQQVIMQCTKRVRDLEAELERERFSLHYLTSFNETTTEGRVTSEDEIRIQPESGSVTLETAVNGETEDVEEEHMTATVDEKETGNDMENDSLQGGEGEMTREKNSDDTEVSHDHIDDYTLSRYPWERQGALIRRSPIPSPNATSDCISPKPAPRHTSAFPLSLLPDNEDRKRSMSTGNLPPRDSDVTMTEDPSSLPDRRRMKTSVSMFEFGDSMEAVHERGDKEGRKRSKGYRPRSINLGLDSEARQAIRRKKQQGSSSDTSHSDDSVLSSLSGEPNVDEELSEQKDNNVFLVLPANAEVASPSEDIFSSNVMTNGKERQSVSGPLKGFKKRVEPVNFMSPDHSLRDKDTNKRESSILDTLPRDVSLDDDFLYPMLSKQDDTQSVQLDEVSMTIYDDIEDEPLESDDGELSSSGTDTEEKEEITCDANKENHSEENVDISEEQSLKNNAGSEESAVTEPTRPEDVIRRKRRPPALTSAYRSGGVSEEDWAQLHREIKQDPELEFCQSQLQAINDQNALAKDACDGSQVCQWSPNHRASKSSSLSPRARSPSPLSRQLSDKSSYALRKMIVSTFLDKEQAYVSCLNLVCQHYQKPLTAVATTSQPMLSTRDCDVVFYKQEELLRIHRQLVEAIESRLSHWSSDQTVAECFGILVFHSACTH